MGKRDDGTELHSCRQAVTDSAELLLKFPRFLSLNDYVKMREGLCVVSRTPPRS